MLMRWLKATVLVVQVQSGPESAFFRGTRAVIFGCLYKEAQKKAKPDLKGLAWLFGVVRVGLEPTTPAFSGLCSTD